MARRPLNNHESGAAIRLVLSMQSTHVGWLISGSRATKVCLHLRSQGSKRVTLNLLKQGNWAFERDHTRYDTVAVPCYRDKFLLHEHGGLKERCE